MRQKIILIGGLLLLYNAKGFAQTSTNVAGGNATSTAGSVSYSVGQVAYTSTAGNGGSVDQGVQHAFAINIVTGVEETTIQLELAAFPNPTTNVLVLHAAETTTRALRYQLVNANGTVLEKNNISNQETTINTQQLEATIYLVQIFENEKLIKTFKIIKQ